MICRNNHVSVEFCRDENTRIGRLYRVEPDKKKVCWNIVATDSDTYGAVKNCSVPLPEGGIVKVFGINGKQVTASYWQVHYRRSGRDAYRVY